MNTSKKAPNAVDKIKNTIPGKKTKDQDDDPKENNRIINDEEDEDFDIPLDDDIKGFDEFDDDEDDDY